jgi:hypothetical protein
LIPGRFLGSLYPGEIRIRQLGAGFKKVVVQLKALAQIVAEVAHPHFFR